MPARRIRTAGTERLSAPAASKQPRQAGQGALSVKTVRAKTVVVSTFSWQELAAHHHRHPIALGIGLTLEVHREIDGPRDTVAELLVDEFLEGGAIDVDQFVDLR
jgi:hypothetical protein